MARNLEVNEKDISACSIVYDYTWHNPVADNYIKVFVPERSRASELVAHLHGFGHCLQILVSCIIVRFYDRVIVRIGGAKLDITSTQWLEQHRNDVKTVLANHWLVQSSPCQVCKPGDVSNSLSPICRENISLNMSIQKTYPKKDNQQRR